MRTKKGFSIVELVVVVAILSLLAAIVVPGMAGQIRSAQQRSDKEVASIITNYCKRAATDNVLNVGMVGYVPIEFVSHTDPSVPTVLTTNSFDFGKLELQTPNAQFAYHAKTHTVKLFQKDEIIETGWQILLDKSNTLQLVKLED